MKTFGDKAMALVMSLIFMVLVYSVTPKPIAENGTKYECIEYSSENDECVGYYPILENA
jgi:hypothetical protein